MGVRQHLLARINLEETLRLRHEYPEFAGTGPLPSGRYAWGVLVVGALTPGYYRALVGWLAPVLAAEGWEPHLGWLYTNREGPWQNWAPDHEGTLA